MTVGKFDGEMACAMSSIFCLDCTDYQGVRVVFREGNREKHLEKHDELHDVSNFIDGAVRLCLLDPDCIYQSVSDQKDRVYYKIVPADDPYDLGDMYRFVRVIVSTRTRPWEIKTAYYKQAPKPREHEQSKCIFSKQHIIF